MKDSRKWSESQLAMECPQIVTHIHKSVDFSVFDTKWVPCSCRFVALGTYPRGTGTLKVYELDGSEIKLQKEINQEKAFKCGTFGASASIERNFATGDFDGKLEIWDLEASTTPVYSAKAHKSIVNCIDGAGGLEAAFGAPEIVTGGRDGAVRVWDQRQREKAVVSIGPEEGAPIRDCWTVAFGDYKRNSFDATNRSVCAAYDNGDIKLFDLAAMKVQWETNVGSGVCCVEFDRKDIRLNKLVATTLDSTFHLYDLRTQHPRSGFSSVQQAAHRGTVWTVKHLPQDRDIFMTTGGSGSLSLWKYTYPKRRWQKCGHDDEKSGVVGTVNKLREATVACQPISTFDWNSDRRGLGVCSAFDQAIRVLIVTKLNTV